jgi:3'-phosphoadenosine 5'-phosphosulfate sulfotransferase (PAPS reductase)/FAD synthetase
VKTNKFSKKVVSSFIIGGLLLSLGGIAIAGTTEDAINSANKTVKSGYSKFFGDKGMRGRGAKAPANMQANLKTKLTTLVNAGTITQTKADAIIAAITKDQAATKAEMEKIKAMTPSERQASRKTANKARVNPISKLVADGVITQADADAIMPQRGFGQDGRGGRGPGMGKGAPDPAKAHADLKTKLGTLVTAGTLTQAKAEAIIAAITKEQVATKAEMEKIKAMTPAERQASRKTANKARVNPISQLVTDRVLTQADADAIAKVMPQRGQRFNGEKGHGLQVR